MLKQSRFVLLASLLLVTFGPAVASARTHVSIMAGVIKLPALSVAGLETDRDRDGLNGPVRRIKTETARLIPKEGKMVEAPRQTLETATYDMKGAKIDYAFFPMATDSLTGKEVYKYDDKGNISEMTLLTAEGAVMSKESYQYEFDRMGNWTKMTTLIAVVENGQMTFEPKEITYRSIAYYLEDSVAKAMQPGVSIPATDAATSPAPAAPMPAVTQVKMEVAANGTPAALKPPAVTNPAPAVAAANNAAKQQLAAQVPAGETVTALAASPITTNLSTSSNLTLRSPETVAPKTNGAPVKTEDGTIPPKPLLRGTPVKPISGGVLNGKALELPKPEYPDIARRSRTTGLVSVEVVIDISGKVLSAKALGGPAMLQRAAEQAALKARFTPTLLSGQPVKMTGTINYNFSF